MKTKFSTLERIDNTDLLKSCPRISQGTQWEEGKKERGQQAPAGFQPYFLGAVLPLPLLMAHLVKRNGWESLE